MRFLSDILVKAGIFVDNASQVVSTKFFSTGNVFVGNAAGADTGTRMVVEGATSTYGGDVLVLRNTNTSGPSVGVLGLDTNQVGGVVDIKLASSNPRGLRIYASDDILTVSPDGAGFQFYRTNDVNFPGQVYFDSGAHNSAAIIFRTTQTGGIITERMRISSDGDVSVSSLSGSGNRMVIVNSSGVLSTQSITTGTVTSVAITVPTGLQIWGSPITTSGTLAITYASGYAIPTTVKQSNWDDAYMWVANFPTQTGNSGKYLTTDGNVLSWATVTAGISGSGTTNYIPKWSGSTSLADSSIYMDGSNVAIGATAATAVLHVRGSASALVGGINFTTNSFTNGSSGTILRINTGAAYGNTYGVISVHADGGTTSAPLSLNTVGGNVLIGTGTDSGFKLDVNGTARVSSDLYANGSAIGFGAVRVKETSGGYGLVVHPNASTSTYTQYNASAITFWNGSVAATISQISGSLYNDVNSANAIYNRFSNAHVFTITSGGAVVGASSLNASAVLEATSTTKGFLPPRQTEAQRTAITSPAVGLVVYQTDGTEGLYENTSTGWRIVNAAGAGSGVTGTGTSGYIAYWDGPSSITGESGFYYDATNDRMGLGTDNPEVALDIHSQGTGNTRGLQVRHNDNTTAFSQAKFIGARSRGSVGSPSAVLANDSLVSFNARGYKDTGWSNTLGGMYIYASENFTDTSTGTFITFRGVANGGTTVAEWMRIANTGNVLINTTTDSGYKLDVNGTARIASEVAISGATVSGVNLSIGSGDANNHSMRIYGGTGGARYFSISHTTSEAIIDWTNNTGGVGTRGLILQSGAASLTVANAKFSTVGFVVATNSTNPSMDASAIIQADSDRKGFLPPRMTETQKNAISTPATGLIVYQTDGTAGLYVYTGAAWKSLAIVA